MVKVIVDCENLIQKKKAHLYLAQMLDFPEYYGKNLDALFDCLTEMSDCTITLEKAEFLRDGYGAKVLKVMRDAVRENPGLIIKI